MVSFFARMLAPGLYSVTGCNNVGSLVARMLAPGIYSFTGCNDAMSLVTRVLALGLKSITACNDAVSLVARMTKKMGYRPVIYILATNDTPSLVAMTLAARLWYQKVEEAIMLCSLATK